MDRLYLFRHYPSLDPGEKLTRSCEMSNLIPDIILEGLLNYLAVQETGRRVGLVSSPHPNGLLLSEPINKKLESIATLEIGEGSFKEEPYTGHPTIKGVFPHLGLSEHYIKPIDIGSFIGEGSIFPYFSKLYVQLRGQWRLAGCPSDMGNKMIARLREEPNKFIKAEPAQMTAALLGLQGLDSLIVVSHFTPIFGIMRELFGSREFEFGAYKELGFPTYLNGYRVELDSKRKPTGVEMVGPQITYGKLPRGTN